MTSSRGITSLYAAAPLGLGVLGADLRWVDVNAAMAALQRRPRAEVVGSRPVEVHPAIGAQAEACAREVLGGGGTVRRVIGGATDTGDRWFELTAFAVDGGVGMTVVEVTARVEAERLLGDAQRRDALLVRAGQLLSAALTTADTLAQVAHLLVPELADWCEVELADGGRVALGTPDGAAREAITLVARGRRIGRLAFGTAPGRALRSADVDTARALADRAALALDNARLYHQRDHVAATLQEELLPPALPDVPGLDVAARYRAAGEGNAVGGDFYDLFASGDGWQVVIGDVVGTGPSAAAVTGLARSTLRAAAAYEGAPSQLLRLLNAVLLSEREGRLQASVACVRIEPADTGLDLTVCAAGHPLPLLVRTDGTVHEVGRYGALLGVDDELVVFNVPARLQPGELLVLYTDGVTDNRRAPGDVFGEAELHALLRTVGGAAPDAVLAAVAAAVGDDLGDDVAIVVLRARPGAVPRATGG